jgi:ketosteroid isomerase-like protein
MIKLICLKSIKEMKKTSIIVLTILVFASACSSSKKNESNNLKSYSPASQELYNEIAHMDSVLFSAFNSHDLDKLKKLFTDDLEFYHDQEGLTNYTQNMEAFKNIASQTKDLRRELITGSLEVYPLKDYGAIQTGTHQFCHTEKGKPDCGIFKFVHIWKKSGGEWKISRVVSYGH